MKSFKFQLFSDIHLEYYKSFPKIPKIEKYLILAGDIGKINTINYKNFFDYCSNNWEKVFYVLGNHEYYHSQKTFNNLNEDYHNFIKQYPNVYLLDNSHYDLDDNFRIIGSTLWSNPNITDGLNDFKHINELKNQIYNKLGFSLDTFKILHNQATKYLQNEIYKNDKQLLIITHFPPSQINTSHPKYQNQPKYKRDYFASNILNDIYNKNNIKGWIFGHTHYTNDIIINNIRLISNQMGYPNEDDINMNCSGKFEIKIL